MRFVSDAFRLSKLGSACATEASAEMGEKVAVCVQIKKVLPETSRAMLAVGHGFRLNWLEPQVSTMNFCNLLILQNKFNWLKPVAQVNEAVFSISQANGVGYWKCASSVMLSLYNSRNACMTETGVEAGEGEPAIKAWKTQTLGEEKSSDAQFCLA